MITIEQIRNAISETVPEVDANSIPEEDKLRDHDIDSLDFFNVVLELQEIAGREIPDEDVDQLVSIKSIYQYFQS